MNGIYKYFLHIFNKNKLEEEKKLNTFSSQQILPKFQETFSQKNFNINNKSPKKESNQHNNNIIIIDDKQLHTLKYLKKDLNKHYTLELTKYFKKDKEKPTSKPLKEKAVFEFDIRKNRMPKPQEREPRESNQFNDPRVIINKKKPSNPSQMQTSSQSTRKTYFDGNMEIVHNSMLNIHQEREKDISMKQSQSQVLEHIRPDEARLKIIQEMIVDKGAEITIGRKEEKIRKNSEVKNPFVNSKKNHEIENFSITCNSQVSEKSESQSNNKDSNIKSFTNNVMKKNTLINNYQKNVDTSVSFKDDDKNEEESPQSFNPISTQKYSSIIVNNRKDDSDNIISLNEPKEKEPIVINKQTEEKSESEVFLNKEILNKQNDISNKEQIESIHDDNNKHNDIAHNIHENQVSTLIENRDFNQQTDDSIKEHKNLEKISFEKPKHTLEEVTKQEVPRRVFQIINNHDKNSTSTNNNNNTSKQNAQEDGKAESLLLNKNNPFAPKSNVGENNHNTTSIFMSSKQLDNPFKIQTSNDSSSNLINNPFNQGVGQNVSNLNFNSSSNFNNSAIFPNSFGNQNLYVTNQGDADMECEDSTIPTASNFHIQSGMSNTCSSSNYINGTYNHNVNNMNTGNNSNTIFNQNPFGSNNTINNSNYQSNVTNNNISSLGFPNNTFMNNNSMHNHSQNSFFPSQTTSNNNINISNNPFPNNLWNISSSHTVAANNNTSSNPFFAGNQKAKNPVQRKSFFDL